MLKEQNPKTTYHKKIQNTIKTGQDFITKANETMDIMPDDEADWDDIYKAANEHKQKKNT